jgi:hypothetical protein
MKRFPQVQEPKCSLEHWQFIGARSRCKYFRSSKSEQYIVSLQNTMTTHQKENPSTGTRIAKGNR